jgi:hypothetical protein
MTGGWLDFSAWEFVGAESERGSFCDKEQQVLGGKSMRKI